MQKALEQALLQAKKSGFFSYPNHAIPVFPQEILSFPTLELPSMSWWEASPLIRIDLSNNLLETLPAELISQNPDLQNIRVQNNRLLYIPDEFFVKEVLLKSIDFSNNQIKSLPKRIFFCKALVELVLANNNIEQLPDLSSLLNLESLLINNNKLIKTPSISGLSKLKTLNLSNNKLTNVELSSFSGLINVEQLILRSNIISQIPPTLFKDLKKLILLDISENQMTSFESLTELTSLDSLLLAFNRLSSFKGIEKFPNLTVLDLKNNKLKGLDVGVINLKKLKTLDVSNNDLLDLPNELGFLAGLVRISFIGNPIKTIKPALRDSGAEVLKQFLRGRCSNTQEIEPTKADDLWQTYLREFLTNNELILKEKQIEEIDKRVFEIKGLKILDLSKNSLRGLKGEFQALKNLKVVRFNENKFEKAPLDLLAIEPLQELELQGNKLQEFYENVKESMFIWKDLRLIDLSRNTLRSIPHMIPHFLSLKTLNLAYNQIEDITNLCNENMRNLCVLDVSNNRIMDIPKGFWDWFNSLTHLNLENNELTKLPSEIGFMYGLKSLKVDGNPIKLLRRTVIEKGTNEIMSFLRSRHTGEPPRRMEIENVEENKENIIENNDIKIKKGREKENFTMKNEDFEEKQIGFSKNSNIIVKKKENNEKTENIINEDFYVKRKDLNKNTNFINNKDFIEKNDNIPYNNNVKNLKENQNFTENIDIKKNDTLKKLKEVEETILKLENELTDNYSLNNFQKTTKKKELQQLIIKKNQLKL